MRQRIWLCTSERLKLSCTSKVGGFWGHLLGSKNGEDKLYYQCENITLIYIDEQWKAFITEKFNLQIWIVHCDQSLI